MRPVVLEGTKVALSVLMRDDIPTLWKWYNDRRVMRYLAKPYEVFFYEDELEWYETLRRNKAREKVFTVVTREQRRPVGLVGLYNIDFQSRNAEIGYILGPEHWRKGYGTEAVALLLSYAFEWLNLRKVYARVYEPNGASIKILESNGFIKAGRLRKHQYVPGEGFVDVLLYERFRDGEEIV